MPIGVLILMAVVLLSDTPSGTAQPAGFYPWCAVGGGSRGGSGRSCYFASRDLCLQTISGIGGFCIENPAYTPPAILRATETRQRRRS